VFGEIDSAAHVAVVSVRRLREPFYSERPIP